MLHSVTSRVAGMVNHTRIARASSDKKRCKPIQTIVREYQIFDKDLIILAQIRHEN